MEVWRGWIAAAGVAGAAIGGIAALALGGAGARHERAAGVAAGPDPVRNAPLAELREELRLEREASRALADELARLRADVEARHAKIAAPPEEPEIAEAPAATAAPPSRAWFDDRALRELGTRPDDIERLRALYEESQLEILYLRDRATREDWIRQPRFQKTLRDHEAQLHEQLGDEEYDLLLYATGRPNRVVIQGTFEDSPAERAGLQSGDTVLRYGEQSIFSTRDLRQATTRGRAGATVALDVLRDDTTHRLYVPRGPLGAHLRAEHRSPDARW